MAYTNTPAPESIEVEVLEVFPSESAVLIQGKDGAEGKFNVIAPANISYAKVGKAMVKFSGENISYLRNSAPAQEGYQRSYPNQGYKKPYGGYAKPAYQPAPSIPNGFQQAAPMVQPKVENMRKVVLAYEDITLAEYASIYNKISSIAEIKASQVVTRPDISSEKIDGKEVIHLRYDARMYVNLPNSVSYNVLNKLRDELRKEPSEEEKDITI